MSHLDSILSVLKILVLQQDHPYEGLDENKGTRCIFMHVIQLTEEAHCPILPEPWD